ncbi:hypothetical protein [Bacteroides stercorirosoris]|uniref:Uncharacterized protein n=1 Tax=Bacteroides stercorirosoris TaxID=871324 RepID=A0A1M6L612_9BACE|nr:hypothetical protein [Bacteroides stercorirosoris]SHJ66607.1 hypothetical protein SAMN05444350_14440 [Bacteroides stercorirosoris]
MDVNVKVTVDLGEKTVALLTGGMVGNNLTPKVEPKPAAPKEEVAEKPAEEKKTRTRSSKPAEEKKTRTRSSKPVEDKATETKKDAPAFADLDDDAKLEAIKAEVTKQTKNKKGADVKWMLAQFNAASVSKAEPLEPEDYDAFYDAITRYGKGEALTDIFPSDDNDLG